MNAKKLCASLAILALVLLGGGASFAELGTIDAVPASTLLLPYFEVDLDSASGVNTLFSINNASAAPTVAHVVIWSDMTIPVLDFNVYLTGYDVQTLNLYNIFVNGTLPATADYDSDPVDAVSPNGAGFDADGNAIPLPLVYPAPIVFVNGSGWDDSFVGCEGAPGTIPGILLDRLQNGLTGNGTLFDNGDCLGFNHGDNIARGYVTVDNVTECNVLFPGDGGYFGTAGVVSDVNQLWGDFFIVDSSEAFAFGETLVHIESNPNVFSGQTFYGRYVGFDGSDGREALGNQFAVRYLQGGGFSGGTDYIVWREGSLFNPATDSDSFTCGFGPSWYPMNETNVVAFDEEERWELLCEPTETTSPISPNTGTEDDPNCFPLEAQRVKVGDANDNLHLGELSPSWDFGWMFLDLEAPTSPAFENQAWVIANMSALGEFSVGFDAIQLNNVTNALPPGGIQ